MATFDNNETKLAFAETAIAGLRHTIKKLEKQLADTVSVRDQFAMAVLPALMQQPNNIGYGNWAKASYEIADMMMEARAALGEKDDG